MNPFEAQEATLHIPIHELGISAEETYQMEDLLTDTCYSVRGETFHIRLDPNIEPAVIFSVYR